LQLEIAEILANAPSTEWHKEIAYGITMPPPLPPKRIQLNIYRCNNCNNNINSIISENSLRPKGVLWMKLKNVKNLVH
jgi:hypothetical protein